MAGAVNLHSAPPFFPCVPPNDQVNRRAAIAARQVAAAYRRVRLNAMLGTIDVLTG